jgi:hypothetical protein
MPRQEHKTLKSFSRNETLSVYYLVVVVDLVVVEVVSVGGGMKG